MELQVGMICTVSPDNQVRYRIVKLISNGIRVSQVNLQELENKKVTAIAAVENVKVVEE